MQYRHVQWGAIFVPVALAAGLAIGVMVTVPDDDGPAWITPVVTIGLVVLLVAVALMSRLEVTVDQDSVTAAFGFGRPHRVIQLDDVANVRQVRNNFWYGFGLRKVRNGWMYNVWGLDAVELELAGGDVFRIGTDEPEKLHAAITLALTT